MAKIKNGWHTVYNATVFVKNDRIEEVRADGHKAAIYIRDSPKIWGYTKLNVNEWEGMKFNTFRSGMAKGIYMVQ